MYTEEQASRRLCPAAMNGNDIDPRCLGEKCMAWRWVDQIKVLTRQHTEMITEDDDEPQPERPEGVPEDYIWQPDGEGIMWWVEPVEKAKARRTGYCGMADRPDWETHR